jgi:CRISPR-associated protein Cas5d
MAQRSPTFKVRVRGPYACFTRPEFKTERVSYEVITPSAARGILEAILWKPAIRWVIERVHILAPVKFEGIRRNEVNSKASLRGNLDAYCADEDRAQRNTLMLRDVDYVIEAHFVMTEKAGERDNLAKFVESFQRRLDKGQCFHTPYFGCREMVATFEPAPERWQVPESLRGRRQLGLMLLDLAFAVTGRGTPLFFDAEIREGTVEVPEVHP